MVTSRRECKIWIAIFFVGGLLNYALFVGHVVRDNPVMAVVNQLCGLLATALVVEYARKLRGTR